ncbi:hypothetical protein A1F94_002121 [Pyrenophora tritici-repentis]|nr:hypothetical protein A1F94_002121 [Pyrenophora tritici-repentis]
MAAEKEEWKIPQLTAENHDTWFRRNKVKLKGRKSSMSARKSAYKDSALLLVLIRSLPKEFKTTIDTLNAQLNLTVEQKLKFLEEKEVRDQQDANEKALPAFRKTEKGRPGKLTTIPPTAPSDERVPNLVDEEGPEEPYTQSVREEAPRYFTRQAKRKRSNEEVVEDERFSKIVKAMLAQAGLIEEQTRLSEKAFAATEIAGIQIPQTHEQAINDPKYGKCQASRLGRIIMSY